VKLSRHKTEILSLWLPDLSWLWILGRHKVFVFFFEKIDVVFQPLKKLSKIHTWSLSFSRLF